MPIDILMPALSPTMTEGTLAKWVKQKGDTVESGDVIAEIETDKATMEVEAVDEGVLGKIVISEGTEGVAVNSVIAVLLEEGEEQSALDGYEAGASAGASVENAKEDVAAQSASSSEGVAAETKQIAAGNNNERVFASPLARRIAAQENVNISSIAGSGPHGRIIRDDVVAAVESGAATGQSSAAENNVVSFEGAKQDKAEQPSSNIISGFGRVQPEIEEIKNNSMRKTIAKRLLESKQTIPHFYLTIDLQIDDLLALRKQLNERASSLVKDDEKPAYKLSVNDMIVRACALGLRDIPEANASWSDDAVLRYNNVDLSVAVAIDGGLVTPVVRNADLKTISSLSNELKDLISRARKGSLMPEEYQGGGFTVSNLGMYGVKQFNAIINPPQSCILAVGASEKKVIVKNNGDFSAVTSMQVTLSCDHRVVDGAVGARFLSAFKGYIENPMTMLV